MNLTDEQIRIGEEYIKKVQIEYEKKKDKKMAEMNRGFKEIAILIVKVFEVENGWVVEVQKDKSMDSEVLIARSRDELNKIIEKLPINLIHMINKT